MSIREFLMPRARGLADRCAAWTAQPWDAPPTKPAATVILLRDGRRGIEVFMQRRVPTMAFAPRMTVFPGGSVDAGDREMPPWAGPTPDEWGETLGCPAAQAAALVTAAIRELYEEAGVLLAGAERHTCLGTTGNESLANARGRLLTRERTLAQVLTEHALLARTDLLGYHAHWITPEVEPRRYDTHFFTALVPAGQLADAETTEAEVADWVVARDILHEATDSLMPPTRVCLEAVAAAPSAAALVATRSAVPVVMPVPAYTEAGWAMRADLP